MPIHKLIEQNDNYSKKSGSLWQSYRHELALSDAATLTSFPINSASFKIKQKIAKFSRSCGTKAVQIVERLKYLSTFWTSYEIPLIYCEINLILTWSANCIISNAAANQDTTFRKTDTKLYVPVVALLAHDTAKLLQQL